MNGEYGLLGGSPRVVERRRGYRWLWKAGIEWNWADLWVGIYHRPIAQGHEVFVCVVPCLVLHAEWWRAGRADP